ncbi:MAG: adenylyltransferase/cytidyltransferase family protein [Candidatus Pacebacteria bacterium]|nr:adenylyltransferase/cytidyltransferase family protein [Candidatus Paceibacterota bacterium]
MKKVFVSGCYDILHAGHIQFFEDARALGDHLTVCFASTPVLALAKMRPPAIPDDHKMVLIGSLKCVDRVVSSSDLDPVFDFVSHWDKDLPDILAVTEDDRNLEAKRRLCAEREVVLEILPKRPPRKGLSEGVSTTSILATIKNIKEVPLRIDFGGGWLDVPRLSKKGAYIVNCTIVPKVSLTDWQYEKNAGLGGSAAYAILKVKDSVESELDLGVGWQDPAAILETGICVWRSGKRPVLESKHNPDWLKGKMLVVWTGAPHMTPDIVKMKRDYSLIKKAGDLAKAAVEEKDINKLGKAILTSYKAQIGEGMAKLPMLSGSIGHKYLGGGHGGYALYLFVDKKRRDKAAKGRKGAKIVEPYIRDVLS